MNDKIYGIIKYKHFWKLVQIPGLFVSLYSGKPE